MAGFQDVIKAGVTTLVSGAGAAEGLTLAGVVGGASSLVGPLAAGYAALKAVDISTDFLDELVFKTREKKLNLLKKGMENQREAQASMLRFLQQGEAKADARSKEDRTLGLISGLSQNKLALDQIVSRSDDGDLASRLRAKIGKTEARTDLLSQTKMLLGESDSKGEQLHPLTVLGAGI